MTSEDYALIDKWIDTVGQQADKLGFQFVYAEGWKCACVAIRQQMDDHKAQKSRRELRRVERSFGPFY